MGLTITIFVIGIIYIIIKLLTGGYDRQVAKSQMPSRSDIDKAEQFMAQQMGVTKFIKKPDGTVKFMMTSSQFEIFKQGEGANYKYTVVYNNGYYIVDNLEPI